MKKIEAMNQLLTGEIDGIKHGTSVFIVEKDSIVNKRSKKVLDMKHLSEDGWEAVIEPKWYDNIANTKGILCWIKGGDVSIIKNLNENGLFENMFGDVLGDIHEVWPVEAEELADFLIYGLPHARKTRKKAKEEEELEESDDGVVITEGNDEGSQRESLESTATPKEDAGNLKIIEEIENARKAEEQIDEGRSEDFIPKEEIPF